MMDISFCQYLQKYLYATDCDYLIDPVSDQEILFDISFALTPFGIDN